MPASGNAIARQRRFGASRSRGAMPEGAQDQHGDRDHRQQLGGQDRELLRGSLPQSPRAPR